MKTFEKMILIVILLFFMTDIVAAEEGSRLKVGIQIKPPFIMKNNDISIDFISATNKLKHFITDNMTSLNYKERKTLAISTTLSLIQNTDEFNKWTDFFKQHKKKDDLSDCFLQGLWFCKYK